MGAGIAPMSMRLMERRDEGGPEVASDRCHAGWSSLGGSDIRVILDAPPPAREAPAG